MLSTVGTWTHAGTFTDFFGASASIMARSSGLRSVSFESNSATLLAAGTNWISKHGGGLAEKTTVRCTGIPARKSFRASRIFARSMPAFLSLAATASGSTISSEIEETTARWRSTSAPSWNGRFTRKMFASTCSLRSIVGMTKSPFNSGGRSFVTSYDRRCSSSANISAKMAARSSEASCC